MPTKKPSAKQLAARAKFVKMVRAKAAKSKATKSKEFVMPKTKKELYKYLEVPKGKIPKIVKIVGKVAKKKAAKKKTIKQTGTSNKVYDKRFSAKKPGKRISKKGNKYTENRANRSDKGRLLGIGKFDNKALQDLKEVKNKIQIFEKEVLNHKVAIKVTKNIDYKNTYKKQLIGLKKYLSELKTHAKELKKLL